jgi:class 3 adenylate cyclase
MSEDQIRYALFPVMGLSSERSTWDVRSGEISFSGRVQNLCVCFIDMIGSTKISSELTPAQLGRYYEIFLNAIALIAKNFGARIVKNAGDALIFYFDDVTDSKNALKFKRVLDCCLTMGLANSALNAKMLNEKLPPIKYRISAEYGPISVARSISSQSDDLFGTAMNISAKINSIAKPNGLVIGQNLFDIVKGLDEYRFSRSDVPLTSAQGAYISYHVEEKEKRDFINPFERRPTN